MTTHIPKTMNAVRFKSAGVVSYEPVNVPEIQGHEVLLKVLAAGLCQTDIHIRHDSLGRMPQGITLGHEIAGEVVEVGRDCTGLDIGDKVVVHPCWSCGRCNACISGRENACQSAGGRTPPPTPGVSVNGGMADYVAVPASALVPIGDLDPAFAAILADAGLAPYHSVRLTKHRLGVGSTAAVIGVGGLGQFAVQFFRELTSAKIIAVDISEKALQAVEPYCDMQLLASDSVGQQLLDYTDRNGVDVVIDLVGNDQSLRLAASVIAPYGAIQVIGLSGGQIPFEATQESSVNLPWGASIMKPYSGSYQDLADVIALAKEGRITAAIERNAMADAVNIFDKLECGGVCGRAVLIP